MQYKLNVDELEIMKKVTSITMVDYEIENDYIPVDSFISAIEDLICEIHNQEERYEDLEQNIRDNYRQLSPAEMYGISDKDFY